MKISEILVEKGIMQAIGKAAGVAKVMGQEFSQGSKKWQGTGITGGANKGYDDEDETPASTAPGTGVDNQLIGTAIKQVLKGQPLSTQKARDQFALIYKKQVTIPNQTKDWNSHWFAAADKLSKGEPIQDPNQNKALELYLQAIS
jgi:hypothetical protein